jgi:hypothetical protein
MSHATKATAARGGSSSQPFSLRGSIQKQGSGVGCDESVEGSGQSVRLFSGWFNEGLRIQPRRLGTSATPARPNLRVGLRRSRPFVQS